jgi:hypothetical protein
MTLLIITSTNPSSLLHAVHHDDVVYSHTNDPRGKNSPEKNKEPSPSGAPSLQPIGADSKWSVTAYLAHIESHVKMGSYWLLTCLHRGVGTITLLCSLVKQDRTGHSTF